LLKMSEGSDPLKANKLKAVKKFKRIQALKKLSRYFVLYCLPPLLCLAAFSICFNLRAVLLALRVVCLVKIPEVWHFCSSQWFLFILINVIVLRLVVLSGSLAPVNGSEDLYEEFVRRNETARKYYYSRPVLENKPANSESLFPGRRNSVEVTPVLDNKPSDSEAPLSVRRNSVEETARPRPRKPRSSKSVKLQQSQISEDTTTATADSLIVIEVPEMSAEELQRKSDEFIAKNNRRIGEESTAFYQEIVKRKGAFFGRKMLNI
ncbi:hypothetical protein KI387_001569, partial [Taxus chinensis]